MPTDKEKIQKSTPKITQETLKGSPDVEALAFIFFFFLNLKYYNNNLKICDHMSWVKLDVQPSIFDPGSLKNVN